MNNLPGLCSCGALFRPDYCVRFAPLFLTTESRVLATHMGQIVMVVEANKTTQAAVKQAISTIESCPVKLTLPNKAQYSAAGSPMVMVMATAMAVMDNPKGECGEQPLPVHPGCTAAVGCLALVRTSLV